MNLRTLMTALLISAAGVAFGQDEKSETSTQKKPTEAELNFSMDEGFVNVRDYVYLKNRAKMIVELNNPEQYNELKGLDTIISRVMNDISFYSDSLRNYAGNVRIDVTLDEQYPFSKIRVKRHTVDGDIFMNRGGDVARLKLDQDTVRVYVRHNPVMDRANLNRKDWGKNWRYNVNHLHAWQVTFCVNNYGDVAGVVADRATLNKAIDTLKDARKKGRLLDPNRYPSSAAYYPYGLDTVKTERCNTCMERKRFKLYNGLAKLDIPGERDLTQRSDVLFMDGNLGASLVRNTFAPTADLGLTFTHYARRPYHGKYNETVIRAYVSSYFLFDRNAANEFTIKNNLFLNADIGEGYNLNFGAGYMLYGNSPYFKGTTCKLFVNSRVLKKGLTLTPELMFTDNFKSIFPVITLKVF